MLAWIPTATRTVNIPESTIRVFFLMKQTEYKGSSADGAVTEITLHGAGQYRCKTAVWVIDTVSE